MDHGGGDGDMKMPMPNGMMMHMTFFWGKNVEILFPGWPEKNLGMYILALFFVFLLALAVEILSFSHAVKPGSNPTKTGLTQAAIHALRMGLAYLVMLSVMSFNAGIFLVAVAGHAVGSFIIKFRVARSQQIADQSFHTSSFPPKV
ncbi:hypothetical protein HHK36_018454 [Tetracentron sinense]|uniref:Copper transport protein n=1 Tax=Tetracentron sinense TaxID=13715 RepID=A0A834Z1I3_TETSI|nr:hypothetical protein HHK36_018454 [Tetracentron sinense]